jgi:hypothetical protein
MKGIGYKGFSYKIYNVTQPTTIIKVTMLAGLHQIIVYYYKFAYVVVYLGTFHGLLIKKFRIIKTSGQGHQVCSRSTRVKKNLFFF